MLPSIPILDFSQRDEASWLPALDAACKEWGCFQLVSHPLTQLQTRQLLTETKRFFSLPQNEKYKIERTETNPWGYYDRELTKNVRDWKEILDIGPSTSDGPFADARPQWPSSLAGFRECMQAYFCACESLALTLLVQIADCLKTPAETFMDGFSGGSSSFLRLNYYPICEVPDEHLGISPHTDSGALTILLADDQPGLQFWHNNEWHTVEPEPDALIVNLGDIAQVWSNVLYIAPLHRVLANRDNPRYSAPFFFNPRYDFTYAPVLNEITGNEARYSSINWGDFRQSRAAGDYRDQGEEIQVSHFKR